GWTLLRSSPTCSRTAGFAPSQDDSCTPCVLRHIAQLLPPPDQSPDERPMSEQQQGAEGVCTPCVECHCTRKVGGHTEHVLVATCSCRRVRRGRLCPLRTGHHDGLQGHARPQFRPRCHRHG